MALLADLETRLGSSEELAAAAVPAAAVASSWTRRCHEQPPAMEG
jgi:hypothetical protein